MKLADVVVFSLLSRFKGQASRGETHPETSGWSGKDTCVSVVVKSLRAQQRRSVMHKEFTQMHPILNTLLGASFLHGSDFTLLAHHNASCANAPRCLLPPCTVLSGTPCRNPQDLTPAGSLTSFTVAGNVSVTTTRTPKFATLRHAPRCLLPRWTPCRNLQDQTPTLQTLASFTAAVTVSWQRRSARQAQLKRELHHS